MLLKSILAFTPYHCLTHIHKQTFFVTPKLEFCQRLLLSKDNDKDYSKGNYSLIQFNKKNSFPLQQLTLMRSSIELKGPRRSLQSTMLAASSCVTPRRDISVNTLPELMLMEPCDRSESSQLSRLSRDCANDD